MYNIKLDENKFYTGSYAKVGKVQDGINIPTLPPTDDNTKALCYKYDYHDVITYEYDTVYNEETGEIEVDEEGNIVTIEREVITSVLEWIFDEYKYQLLMDEIANYVPELTSEEKIAQLSEDNELLKGCIMELADILFA